MIAPAHADAINVVEHACLYGVCGRNPEKTDEFAKKYGAKALDGGGALMNQGIHGIDLLLYITGGAKLISARAKTVHHNIEVEDTAVAFLEYPSGAIGVIEGSTCAYPGFERSLEIHGSTGYVNLKSGIIEKLIINGEDVTPKNEDVERHNSSSDPKATGFMRHAKEYENFISAINGEEELLIDACEGKKAVELIENIYKTSAAWTGKI